MRRGRCAVRPGPGARLVAPRGPRRFVSGVFGFVCSRCVRFLVKTSHSVRICIPSPIPFGFGANRYDWGNCSFPSVCVPRLVMVSPNQSGALQCVALGGIRISAANTNASTRTGADTLGLVWRCCPRAWSRFLGHPSRWSSEETRRTAAARQPARCSLGAVHRSRLLLAV